ncbi:MAG: hypothetical protein CMJ58_23825 [Planctomycetaceae bacterium]|nr:hypothetical protein [Planctomycetaceae bacterium]
MRAWELFRQAMFGAARAKLRSSLTAAGIAIGCGALVSMVAFALGLQQQMERPFKQLGLLNDIHVSPSRDGGRGRDDPDEPDADQSADEQAAESANPPAVLDEAAVTAIRDIPGVKFAYPDLRLANLRLAVGDKSTRASAIAAPRELGLSPELASMLTAGEFFTLDEAPQVLLSSELARQLGFDDAADAVGEQLTVSATGLAAGDEAGQFNFTDKQIEAAIVGVFDVPQFGPFGDSASVALIPADLMQHLPGIVESQLSSMRRGGAGAPGNYRRVVVRAESPAEVERIAKKIRDRGFHARTLISELGDARTAFLFLKSLLAAVGSVAMIIAGLGIANTLLMTVLERYEEIGLYKALGATDGDVRLLFLSEAAVLGLVGGLLGLALAGVVCWGLQWGLTTYMASQGIKQKIDAFYFPLWLLASGVGFSLVISIASGLYPASRAARVEPIEALRRA